MNTKGLFSAIAITLSATLSTPALACSQDNDMTSGILSSYPHHNQSLDFGEYAFASVNSHHNSSFTDRWKFTVAEDMIAAISVFDIEVGFASNDQTSIGKSQKNIENSPKSFDISKIFDTKNMAFTLFDDDAGQFLGWAHENEKLSGLHLAAGRWYTLKVYGDVAGLFGSAYHGSLETVSVSQVPLSDTAPLFGSALALLALRLRNRGKNLDTANA